MFWLMEWELAEEHHNISCAGGTYFLQFVIKGDYYLACTTLSQEGRFPDVLSIYFLPYECQRA